MPFRASRSASRSISAPLGRRAAPAHPGSGARRDDAEVVLRPGPTTQSTRFMNRARWLGRARVGVAREAHRDANVVKPAMHGAKIRRRRTKPSRLVGRVHRVASDAPLQVVGRARRRPPRSGTLDARFGAGAARGVRSCADAAGPPARRTKPATDLETTLRFMAEPSGGDGCPKQASFCYHVRSGHAALFLVRAALFGQRKNRLTLMKGYARTTLARVVALQGGAAAVTVVGGS